VVGSIAPWRGLEGELLGHWQDRGCKAGEGIVHLVGSRKQRYDEDRQEACLQAGLVEGV
jgi:hypothetical protein